MTKVAVTGVGGHIGHAIVRALRHSVSQYRVIGFDMNPGSSGFAECDAGYVLPSVESPFYGDHLISLLQKESVTVVIPGSDHELMKLAKMRSRFESQGIHLILSNLSGITFGLNNILSARFFREYNLPFARSAPIDEGKSFSLEVGFPLVIKPVRWSTARRVSIVFSESELEAYLDQADLIVQEYVVPKRWGMERSALTRYDVFKRSGLRQEEEISVQLVFDQSGQYLGCFMCKLLLVNGMPYFIDPISDDVVLGYARKMAELMVLRGHRGPCNFQCRLTLEGPVFYDVTPRFTSLTSMRALMGFNEVDAVLACALGHRSIEDARNMLSCSSDLVCSRFMTEQIMTRAELKMREQAYEILQLQCERRLAQ